MSKDQSNGGSTGLDGETLEDLKGEILEDSVEEEILQEAGLEELDDVEKQLLQKSAEVEETQIKLLRLHADFDNYRKRMTKEKEEWSRYASQGIIEKLLPVLDNLERAIDSLKKQNEETQSLFSGIIMIHRQFMDIFQNEGLEPIEAVGQVFDPLLHEAMMQVPVEEGQGDNQVVEELRKGFRYKERVIRPAMVKVAKS